MPLLEPAVVLAYLDRELEVLLDRAHKLGLDAARGRDATSVSLRLTGRSETDGQAEEYLLHASFDDYRLLPPLWRFLDPRNGEAIGKPAYPLGDWPQGSVFHPNGVICAPWSREAYKTYGGPHEDWPDLTAWQTTGLDTQTRALTIPDMFMRIYMEVQRSPRRMEPLPGEARAA